MQGCKIDLLAIKGAAARFARGRPHLLTVFSEILSYMRGFWLKFFNTLIYIQEVALQYLVYAF